jgi:hypothetical protein
MLVAQEELAVEGPVISSKRPRLTKNRRIAIRTLAGALALGASIAGAACGQEDPTDQQGKRAVIALQNLDRSGPVYYWHDSATYALLYFRPDDLVARLETLLATQADGGRESIFGDASLALGPALLDNIKVDLPLRETTDLFRYTLIDQRFDTVVNLVIADLMKDGKVMLDQWVFAEHPAKSIVMISRRDADGGEGGRWFCTPANDVLFKTGHAAFD